MATYKKLVLPVLLILLVAAAGLISGSLSHQVTKEHQALAEQAVRSCAVQCYALEGAYPQTLRYLEKHYTLRLDRSHYVYHYRFIGSNMMPEISVFEKDQ